ncbi:hypothetical protein EMPS_03492 [Entomortierella parvispora]|uniref:Uncharacterized protein n=1 Tax=Entomortierella parvispora TaxID=205924 RepID=A0A9P3H6W4_9FUNG|nr:hypothetical protein EMPS_03492 [Entomortierella parvispora]
MRFSAAVVLASLAAFVTAAPVSKAVQSEYFPFTPEGPCVSACTNSVGKSLFVNYDDLDSYGPNFIQSLSYTFERGSPTTISFMTKAGTCMSTCPQPELDIYTANYPSS